MGAHPREAERVVQRITGAPACLGDKVAIQIHRGSDRLVTKPARHLGDQPKPGDLSSHHARPHAVDIRVPWVRARPY